MNVFNNNKNKTYFGTNAISQSTCYFDPVYNTCNHGPVYNMFGTINIRIGGDPPLMDLSLHDTDSESEATTQSGFTLFRGLEAPDSDYHDANIDFDNNEEFENQERDNKSDQIANINYGDDNKFDCNDTKNRKRKRMEDTLLPNKKKRRFTYTDYKSSDFGFCNKLEKGGISRCQNVVDKSEYVLCQFHAAEECRKYAAKRNDTNQTSLSNLRRNKNTKKELWYQLKQQKLMEISSNRHCHQNNNLCHKNTKYDSNQYANDDHDGSTTIIEAEEFQDVMSMMDHVMKELNVLKDEVDHQKSENKIMKQRIQSLQ